MNKLDNATTVYHFIARHQEDNLFHWGVSIVGPEDTPYEGGFVKTICTLQLCAPVTVNRI